MIVLLFVHVGVGLSLDKFVVEGDGPEYLRMAEHMSEGRGFSYDGMNPVVGKPPGISAVVALYLKTFGSLKGFHFLQLLFLFGGYFAISYMVVRSCGKLAGLLTLAFGVAMVPLRDLSSNIMAEPLFMFLFGSGMCTLIIAIRNRSVAVGIAAGALFATATYMRPISLFWPIALLIAIWFTDRQLLRIGMAILAAHILVVAPWVIRNAVTFDRFVPMVANWGPMYGMTNESLWNRYTVEGWAGGFQDSKFSKLIGSDFPYNWAPQERLREATLDGIRSDPLGWTWRCLKQSSYAWTYVPGTKQWAWQQPLLFWIGRLGMLLFYFLSVIGALSLWRRDNILVIVIMAHTAYTAIFLFPVTVESRYLIPAYMYLMPLSVLGVMRIMRRHATAAEVP